MGDSGDGVHGNPAGHAGHGEASTQGLETVTVNTISFLSQLAQTDQDRDHAHQTYSYANLHEGMEMYFHGGCVETILFYGWRISSVAGLAGSMVGIFLLGILYEAIKFGRDHHTRSAYSPVPYNDVNGGSGSGDNEAPENNRGREVVRLIQTKIFSCHHLIQTLLHMVQLTLSYLIMLIFMTYNSWLCGAVIAGLTFGYFLFGWRKPSGADAGEHCH